MKRLLIVVNVDWFFLSHRLPVALAALEAGYEVHVAATLSAPPEQLERYGFKVHALDMDRKSASLWAALRLLLALYRLIREIRPSVVHLVTIKPVLFGGLAARLAGAPGVVAAISGMGFVFTAEGAKARARRTVVAALYRLALARDGVRVIFQNGDDETLLRYHAGLQASQVVRIRGSGVDVAHWPCLPWPPTPPVILLAARLLVDKGVREFVAAARQLRGYRGARFVLVGTTDPGNPSSLDETQIRSWVEDGCIEWWGQREDMPAVLGSAHVVVLPSYREGLPKVLIEAAASGRAVVTTDVPGCRDAIEPGTTGLLVPVRDASALADAIQSLIENPQQRERMGASGRALAEREFAIQKVVDIHLAIYRELLANGANR